MTIRIPATLEERLKDAATQHRVDVEEYAARLIEEGLAHSRPNEATLRLLEKWDAEDEADDAAEAARRRQEAEQFMQNLARNRVEMEGPDARKLWP